MIHLEDIAKPFVQDLISSSTIIIFDFSGKKMKPIGCAIYLKSNDNHYLISATHVFETFKIRCGIQLNNLALAPPRGRLFLSQNKLGKDKIDIGILRLDEFAVKHLSSVYTQPLKIDNIEISCSEQQLGEGYFIFGYPATNKHVDVNMGTDSILCEPLFYLTDDSKLITLQSATIKLNI